MTIRNVDVVDLTASLVLMLPAPVVPSAVEVADAVVDEEASLLVG
jgi:hypothetical protein